MSFTEKDKRAGYCIVQYLQQLLNSDTIDEDTSEGLGVAVQCLCETFEVDLSDPEQREGMAMLSNLGDLIEKKCVEEQSIKEKAEAYKAQGNTHLKMNQFDEAVDCYTKAVELDGSNATYFCNRAAAYLKLKQLEAALSDCTRAVTLDPTYARAHGRLGYIYNEMNKRKEAVASFRKARELDPTNESYLSNLKAVEDQLKEEEGLGASGIPPGMSGLVSSMINNPDFVRMATQMMNSPGFQEAAQRVMTSGVPGAQPFPGMMPDMMEVAEDLKKNNKEMYAKLQEQARRFVPRQTDQKEGEEEDKEAEGADKPAADD